MREYGLIVAGCGPLNQGRKGVASPAVSQWAGDVDDPNPFIASRFA
jgi:hypothetical protein